MLALPSILAMYENIYVNSSCLNKNTIIRAGVIPYTMLEGKLHFLLGIHRLTRDLTDFGGGIKASETPAHGAYRELHEESCEIFLNDISIETIESSPVITNRTNSAIFFVKIDSHWINDAEDTFIQHQQMRTGCKKYTELIGIKWIRQDVFKAIAFDKADHRLWKRIQNMIRLNTNWYELVTLLIVGKELSTVVKKSWEEFKNIQAN